MGYSCNACGRYLPNGGSCDCYKPNRPTCKHGFIEGCCEECDKENS